MVQVARASRRALTSLLLTATAALPLRASPQDAQAAAKDIVQLKNGQSESGRIKSEDYGGLVLEGKGGEKTLLWKDLTPGGISYAGAEDYAAAKEQFDAGKMDEALTALTALKEDPKLRNVIKQNTLFLIPTIHLRQGKFDEAIAGYGELVKAFPKSRYLLEVAENLVQAYSAQKKLADVAKVIDQLSTDALAGGVTGDLSSALNVTKGRALEELGQFAQAQAAYAVAEAAKDVPPSVVQQAQLGRGRVLIKQNKRAEGEAVLRKLVTQDAPNMVLAGAWNTLGDILLADGRPAQGKPDGEKILDALYAYLRGVVQYTPTSAESSVEYERALRGAHDCLMNLSQLETNADKKNLYRQRAESQMKRLKDQYPNSPFLRT